MEAAIITITFQECGVRYGLSEAEVREFVQLGLLHAAPDVPNALREEPEHVARLARLHQELGLSKDSLDVVLNMHRQLEHLQREVRRQRARVRQLETFLGGRGPLLDFDW
ncbi:chaperone modulator CbpM [Hymenobacter actinosclerus]|uniref:Chaperone modulatory protein CbpM n=1 Tax=Hymenobacter actinosclerus TaxID=82805 RepID=A0A1I0HZQ4_9BACT|nr:chaperone modulator CbpM [Hymenobacter actinosclerus]SET88907.1 chaperone modulatory protein CbpM [Hymenobacter actinosclerus]